MKKKIGILTEDENFAKRLLSAMEKQYAEEFQFIRFPTAEQARKAYDAALLDFILADERDQNNPAWNPRGEAKVPVRIYFLTDRLDPESGSETDPKTGSEAKTRPDAEAGTNAESGTSAERETTAKPELSGDSTSRFIFKYKSVSDWHTELNCLCRAGRPAGEEADPGLPDRQRTKLCLFTAGGGGVGTSTAAAAFAVACAGKKRKVLYLDLETYSSVGTFFSGDSIYTLEDIIYAIRSGKYETETVLRHSVIRDSSGVRFIAPCRLPPDMFSLNGEEISVICEKLISMNLFQIIVLDMNFDVSERIVLPFLMADAAVLVTDGGQLANAKTEQLLETLPMIADLSAQDTRKKLWLLYNRYENGKAERYRDNGLGKLGGLYVQPFSGIPALLRTLSAMAPFERLAEELNV